MSKDQDQLGSPIVTLRNVDDTGPRIMLLESTVEKMERVCTAVRRFYMAEQALVDAGREVKEAVKALGQP